MYEKLIFGFVVVLMTFVSQSIQASGAASLSCEKAAGVFLDHPTKHTFATLIEVDEEQCWIAIGSSNLSLQRLTHSVAKGNRWAAEYLAKNLRNLDGGNLEDSLVALGQFSDHNMERFLLFASKEQVSEHEFTDALTMLPLSLSDNSYAQLKVLKARRSMVIRVSRKDILVQKEVALRAIDDFMSEIKKSIDSDSTE